MRGVWGLLDIYLFPGSPTFSQLVSIALGFLVLYLDDFSIDNLKRIITYASVSYAIVI